MIRDTSCRECREITSGDCGKHGPLVMGSVVFSPNQHKGLVLPPPDERTRKALALLNQVEEKEFKDIEKEMLNHITESISFKEEIDWRSAEPKARKFLKRYHEMHGIPAPK